MVTLLACFSRFFGRFAIFFYGLLIFQDCCKFGNFHLIVKFTPYSPNPGKYYAQPSKRQTAAKCLLATAYRPLSDCHRMRLLSLNRACQCLDLLWLHYFTWHGLNVPGRSFLYLAEGYVAIIVQWKFGLEKSHDRGKG